jgi:hypothetical protein
MTTESLAVVFSSSTFRRATASTPADRLHPVLYFRF